MNDRGKRQASSLFGGMGFYIALLCCVLAAGVVGYYALLKEPETPAGDDPGQTVDQTVDNTDPGPSQPVTTPDDAPSLPVIDRTPSVTRPSPVTTAPDDAQDSTPTLPLGTDPDNVPDDLLPGDSVATMSPADIPAQEPMEVTSPLTGETVAVFSVDQLTYNTTLGDWRTHAGIDIQAEAGTAVAAAAAGTVLTVAEDGRLGTTVTIDHGNGYTTTYASLQPETSVQPGDTVAAGTVIGTVGNTSLTESALGAHLHFAVEKDGEPVDPNDFLNP